MDKIIREKIPDGRFERQIIIGMITSTEFLQQLIPIYQDLKIPFARIIAKWCIEYFHQYQKAPGLYIEDIFKDQKNIIDPDEIDMIGTFLLDISEEYVRGDVFNVKYILDKAENHFRELSLKNLMETMKKSLIGGDVEQTEALIKGYKRVARIQTQGIDPITDLKIISSALNNNAGDKLFKLPGDLGNLIGKFERGWLFSFIGASGTGKTWWLILTALTAFFSGLNVVFVSMEMSEIQITKRIQSWISGQPTRAENEELLIPVFDCLKNQEGNCSIKKNINFLGTKKPEFKNAPKTYLPCTDCIGTSEYTLATWWKKVKRKELTISRAIKKSKALKRSALIRSAPFKLLTFPSRSITMNDLKVYLYNFEHYEGFIPDVIITDYADKIKPDDFKQQFRHQVMQIWEDHKSLALERNCLVITASQSNTARSGKDIKQGDWAEAISKLELSDVAMAINMSPENKKQGIMRATIMKQRHSNFDLLQEVMILHQLKIGRPYLDSYLI